MSAHALRCLAAGVPALALVLTGEPGWPIALPMLVALVVAARSRPRESPGLLGVLALEAVVLAVVLFALGVVSARQPRPGVYVTAGALALTVPRLWFAFGRRGQTGTLAFAVLALMGLARSTPRWTFGAWAAALLSLGLLSTLRDDPTFGRTPAKHRRGVWGPLVLALGIAGGTMVGLSYGLLAAEPAVSQALMPYLTGGDGTAKSGFSGADMRLGDAGRITSDAEVVMRVHGEADYLRGQVYSEYLGGTWRYAQRLGAYRDRVVADGDVRMGEAEPRVDIGIEAEAGSGPALFNPLGTVAVPDAIPKVTLDAYGLLKVPRNALEDDRRWTARVARPEDQRVAPPDGNRDSRTASGFHDRLWFDALARHWTDGAASAAQRAERLRHHLASEYAYSLEPGRVRRGDPVLHFLRAGGKGHCEYFASALVLLARSVGIPGRVAAGYRVFEHNPVGGYYIVRKRDAHAWAELWVDGRWQTFDATPAGVLLGEQKPEASSLEALVDLLRRAGSATFEFLADLTALETAGGVAVVGILGLLWVFVRRGREAPLAGDAAGEVFDPLMALEAHLAARLELRRSPSQTLEGYARRLREEGHEDPAGLVEACAAWRYGQVGDPGAIARDVARYTSAR